MRVFRYDLFADREQLREEEKILEEKFGEKCVVLPLTLKPMAQNIAYICDGYACDVCHPEYCHHTTDIEHAENFVKLADGRYIEKMADGGSE